MERLGISNVSRFKGLAKFIAERFCQFGRRCCRWNRRPADPRHRLGAEGERAAAKFLKKNGYKVLYRNFRAPHGGEVDLVCRDKSCAALVFVEVKTRSRDDFGAPSSAVKLEKQRLISKGALSWLRMLDRDDITFRFDIVEVMSDGKRLTCNVIQDAFRLPEPLRW